MKSANSNTTLFFLTTSFPFGALEPLINDEIIALSKVFSKIIIISSSNFDKQLYAVPDNVEVLHHNIKLSFFEKLRSLTRIFSRDLKQEKNSIKKVSEGRFDFKKFKISLIANEKAERFLTYLKDIIASRIILDDNLHFYSYWCEDEVIGLAKLKRKQPSYKVVTRMHAYDLYFERHSPAFLPMRKLILDQVNHVLCISEQGKLYLEGKFKQKFKSLNVNRLGIHSDKPFSINKEELTFNIVSCSAMIALKRIDLIIDTIAHCPLNLKLHWTHFGDGDLEGKIKSYCSKKLSHLNHITYDFKGFVEQKSILDCYAESNFHLFINLSETEGVPISIMEAMCHGIPTLATDVGAVSELINKGSGFLVDKNSSSIEIWDILHSYISLGEQDKINFQRNAFNLWKSEFNAKNNENKLMSFLLD